MFSTFLPTVGTTDPNEFVPPPSKPPRKTDKNYGDALRSYRERHPDATDEDIELIKKEGGDLQSLFFWGVSPEDEEDAAIIAKHNPETGADNETVITDLNKDGTPSNEKKNELPRQLFPFNVFDGPTHPSGIPNQQRPQSQPSNQSQPQSQSNDNMPKKRNSITYLPPFPFSFQTAEPETTDIPTDHNINHPQFFTRDLPAPTININPHTSQPLRIPHVSIGNTSPQPVTPTPDTSSMLPNLNPFTMFSVPVSTTITQMPLSPDGVEDPQLRALVDHEEIKALKNQLAARNINNGGEIDFFRRQLSDSEKTQKLLQKQLEVLSAEHRFVC